VWVDDGRTLIGDVHIRTVRSPSSSSSSSSDDSVISAVVIVIEWRCDSRASTWTSVDVVLSLQLTEHDGLSDRDLINSVRCYCNRTDTGRLPAEWTVADRWCCRSCDRESFSLSSLLLKQRTAMIRTLLAWKDNQVCTTCARRPLEEIIGCVARVFNSNVHRGWRFNPVRALKHSSVLR